MTHSDQAVSLPPILRHQRIPRWLSQSLHPHNPPPGQTRQPAHSHLWSQHLYQLQMPDFHSRNCLLPSHYPRHPGRSRILLLSHLLPRSPGHPEILLLPHLLPRSPGYPQILLLPLLPQGSEHPEILLLLLPRSPVQHRSGQYFLQQYPDSLYHSRYLQRTDPQPPIQRTGYSCPQGHTPHPLQ